MEAHLLVPRPRQVRAHARGDLSLARLDAAQRGAVDLPAGGALLVLGEAGHGKTTVALHRLARLWRAAGTRRFRAAFVVPSEGLARALQPMLVKLGVDLDVVLYDRFARRQGRRAFLDLPRRESRDASAAVIKLKRDPALGVAIAHIAARAAGRIDDDEDAPEDASQESGAWARRGDLQHLFGDRRLMEEAARASGGRLHALDVDDVLDHTRIQFAPTAEEEHAHVDRARLVAVDRRALDEGTRAGDAQTVDAEDYAVLFEIDRLRAARLGGAPTAPRAYDCIVLDEAQEFAPIELALLRRSLAPGGTLVVAGDADQQTDPTTSFESWDATMRALGAPSYARVTLDVGYRCPPEVVALARRVRDGSGAPAAPPLALPDERALGAMLAREIGAMHRRDRRATIAIICRAPLTARRVARLLEGVDPDAHARVVFDGKFPPAGACVTSVDQVKGLELDFVIVPDATRAAYPDDPAARRALYVAVTRARHQVVLAAVGAPTPLV